MKRIVSSLLFVLSTLVAVHPAAAQTKKVTISQAFQSLLYLPLYIGIDNGHFTKQGLDVTKETAGAPSAALAAVISGSAQFSLHGPEWPAIAASKGAPVQIVANCVATTSLCPSNHRSLTFWNF